jgi:hypothetical protein
MSTPELNNTVIKSLLSSSFLLKKYRLYRALLIGFGATLTLTGLHKSSKVGIDVTFVFLFPTSASGVASVTLISTLQASDHTWWDIKTDVSNLKLYPVCASAT